uniref:membrane protein insertase YidC n=1 Tax=Thaumasiovibrio occultus TaxID=1891184 RepID=UPI000B3575FA|nr:membrane protein insertase YidC [Thaumasiovibrio occultus]
MDSQRNILLIALLAVTFMLYQQWGNDSEVQQTQGFTQTNGAAPPAFNNSNSVEVGANGETSNQLITVTTDVLELVIDTKNDGNIVSANLLDYDAELDSDTPFQLLKDDANHQFIAQNGVKLGGEMAVLDFTTSADSFTLAEGADELRVPMTATRDGVTITKTLILKRGSYALDVQLDVNNQSANPVDVSMFAQLKQTSVEDEGSLTMPTYRGGAYSYDESDYSKYSFDDMKDLNLDFVTSKGWVAMIQHYFTVAWIPLNESQFKIYTYTDAANSYIGVVSPEAALAPNSDETLSARLWVGPKLQEQMGAAAPGLNKTVDYGFLWLIATPIHWLLMKIHSVVGNWGVAIIFLTIIIRGGMYPLTKAQYTSMAKMRMLQPKLEEMREKFGEDRQRMSQAMMELYREEKVNPLGGCLPILLQMPIFIAFYWSLMESVQLRHAPFFLWINDLSAQDPYFILPLLMGASMFMIQKMSPSTVSDPMQQKIMTFMPVMFTVFFLFFPSGLVLYWLTSNIVTLTQQTLIYRALEKKGLHSKPAK